ncbi:MAG: oxidoreductase [Candidatus Levybacteria bacterium]|nr:oxidoreductase [Candidatus Levybacteria bacterium]
MFPMSFLKPLDDILNKITMYRLVLYYLIFLWLAAFNLSFFGFFPFGFIELLISSAIIISVSFLTNKLLARIFNTFTNLESVYISAFILILIITPARSINEYIFIILASFFAMASKYILSFNKKHVFNPVAISVLIMLLFTIGGASWWVGTTVMLLPVLFGLLVIRKIQRASLVLTFLITSLSAMEFFSVISGFDALLILQNTLLESPLLFFAFVMLTEPSTTPPRQILQIYYGAIVGILFYPQIHISSFYFTPEAALVAGNIFSYLVSPKEKLTLSLKEKIKLSKDTYDFVFNLNKKFSFTPGQYLEWTLGFKNPDSRGNRRYFTIASSPTEENLRIGIKFYPNSSSFKKNLFSLKPGDKIMAGSLSGDFVLPDDANKKLVFILGGIGITPFRSIVRYLLDKNMKIPAVVFYSNKEKSDIVYKDLLDQAEQKLGIKIIYNLTDLESIPKDWKGEKGRLDENMLKKYVSDYKERIFYLSGPHSMVMGFEEVLGKMGISKTNIKKDFFPGYV